MQVGLVVVAEIFDYALRVVIADRRAEGIDHLANAFLPPGAIEHRRVHLHVVDAVADGAARHDQIAVRRVMQLDFLLAGGVGRERDTQAEEQQKRAFMRPPASASE